MRTGSNNMIKRKIEKEILEKSGTGKAIVILGARQTGKTTLLHQVFDNHEKVLWLNGDEPDVRSIFDNITSARLKSIIGNQRIVIIDEAQRISDCGVKLKLITDQLPSIQLIVSGSSSLDLSGEVKEPLTGRKWEYLLFPMSFQELVDHHGLLEEQRLLNHRLVYGAYPEIVTSPGNEKEVLKQLTDSFLYKDLLSYNGLKKSDKVIKLLQALSFQVGNEVSYNELGNLLDLDNQTVEKYISLLEQIFVVFRVGAFSRNLRKELKRTRKIYFYDNGIRNSLIAQFAPAELRQDIGALWENYMISERVKYLKYNQVWANTYFWRTRDQQEIDWIEEKDGKFSIYEFKWNPKKRSKKFSKSFTGNYEVETQKVITPQNYLAFLT